MTKVNHGIYPVFQTYLGFYKNDTIASGLKNYILSKEVFGIESGVAHDFKHNLLESRFDLFERNNQTIRDATIYFASCIKQTVNNVNQEDIDYEISFKESWYHICKMNSVHECHTHPGCSWCGIFYVQSGNQESGKTLFLNPIDPIYNDSGSKYLLANSSIVVTPEDGTLIIFPSYLRHYQSLYKGTQDRIVVAFNICLQDLVNN